jgi:hypothetical protein
MEGLATGPPNPPTLIAQAIEDALAPFGGHVTRVPVTRAEIWAMTRRTL